MTLPTATAFRRSGSPRLRPLARAHPLAGVLLLTFAFSWGHWIPQALAGAATTVVVMLAAVVILRRQVPRTTPTGAPVVFEGRVEVRCSPTEAFELLANTDRYATGPGSPVLRWTGFRRGRPASGRAGGRSSGSDRSCG